jgi:uncharacterized protein
MERKERVSESVGVVATLRRFPVKSMQGEILHSSVVGPQGVLGDRALAVVDSESGQVVGGKTPGLGPRLLACKAAFTAPPQPDGPLPPVGIELPDGTGLRNDAGDADELLSSYFSHPVNLVATPPSESALVANRRDFLDNAQLLELFDGATLLDALPVSVLTTSTLERLRAARPETDFDERRFRMNVVVTSSASGFLENGWSGRALRIGDAARLRVAMPVPRCALTTMAQEGLPRDPAVLRTVARENMVEFAGRRYACVGAYASVELSGEIRRGDLVHVD